MLLKLLEIIFSYSSQFSELHIFINSYRCHCIYYSLSRICVGNAKFYVRKLGKITFICGKYVTIWRLIDGRKERGIEKVRIKSPKWLYCINCNFIYNNLFFFFFTIMTCFAPCGLTNYPLHSLRDFHSHSLSHAQALPGSHQITSPAFKKHSTLLTPVVVYRLFVVDVVAVFHI